VVTEDDVRFTRFRRDDVGVFELKGMIDTNIAAISTIGERIDGIDSAIKSSVSTAKENVEAIKVQMDTATAAFDTKMDALTDVTAALKTSIVEEAKSSNLIPST
jgi:hypothetical protein